MSTRIGPGVNSASMGQTGPAVVVHCGCNVLPWEDCQHTVWDGYKSTEQVIAEAREPEPAQYPLPLAAAPPPVPADMLLLLARCRKVAWWFEGRRGKRAKYAQALLRDIDAFTGGQIPA